MSEAENVLYCIFHGLPVDDENKCPVPECTEVHRFEAEPGYTMGAEIAAEDNSRPDTERTVVKLYMVAMRNAAAGD